MEKNKLTFEKDLRNKQITVTRHFNADLNDVWRAWTEAELLDQWWGPEPCRAETKKMNFTEGGTWLYAMVLPDGERHWARVDFFDIIPQKTFSAKNWFCDENGNVGDQSPAIWKNAFEPSANGTKVTIVLQLADVDDLQKMLEMGFEQGFIKGLEQLEHYFITHSKIREEKPE